MDIDGDVSHGIASTHSIFERIPLDVLYRIIYFVSVQDIIRLRQVSKFLQEITEARSIWSNAYRTTSLARRLGPFPHQSTATLKDLLFQSAKIACNWAPNIPRPTAKHPIEVKQGDCCHSLLLGRWLMFVDESRTQIRCFDLDSADRDCASSIVYNNNGTPISDFHSVSTTSVGGHDLALVIVRERPGTSMDRIKILKVLGHEGPLISFEPAQTYSISWKSTSLRSVIGPRLLVISGEQLVICPKEVLYVDLATYQTYKMTFTVPVEHYIPTHVSFISCATHLLVLRSFLTTDNTSHTIIDVFPLASANMAPKPGSLDPSHSGEWPSYFNGTHLLCDPSLHSQIDDPRISFVFVSSRNIGKRFATAFYGVAHLTLSNKMILLETQELFRQVQGQHFFICPCLNGSTRAICISSPSFAARLFLGEGLEHAISAITLTVDESSAVTLSTSAVKLPGMSPCAAVIGFDGNHGRIVWRTSTPHGSILEAVDFA
ncbi:hypothetical protein BV22DRAFT_1117780 [Leucogyrophana mollusca]|uniref:Uncharacterized protein n=1 Tax=Leucogyrophana mollusca TaxID=85980 RepID=A0ACB8BT30_9AGAM|nr:hypothetical protein BV22DRAFT_1117780 [Leucogyrophana mollusca]